jgi:hypothetical protein
MPAPPATGTAPGGSRLGSAASRQAADQAGTGAAQPTARGSASRHLTTSPTGRSGSEILHPPSRSETARWRDAHPWLPQDSRRGGPAAREVRAHPERMDHDLVARCRRRPGADRGPRDWRQPSDNTPPRHAEPASEAVAPSAPAAPGRSLGSPSSAAWAAAPAHSSAGRGRHRRVGRRDRFALPRPPAGRRRRAAPPAGRCRRGSHWASAWAAPPRSAAPRRAGGPAPIR